MTPYDTKAPEHDEWTEQPMDPAMARLLHSVLTPLQDDLDHLRRQVTDRAGPAATATATAAVRADLGAVLDQGRQTSHRLTEELGALGVQLRQQHMDMSDRIMTMQAGVGVQFDAVAAAIATSSSHVSRVADQLAQRQNRMLTDAVQKELALQLLPLQARMRGLTALLGLSVGLSVGAFVLLIMAALK